MELEAVTEPDETEPQASPPDEERLPFLVAETLSHLAHLLDEQIAVRGTGIGVREFAAGLLQVSTAELVVTEATFSPLDFQLVSIALADDLAAHPPIGLIGEDAETPPRWQWLRLGSESRRVPTELAAGFARGTVALPPLVVHAGVEWPGPRRFLHVYSRPPDTGAAERYLDELRRRSTEQGNPFRGRCVEAVTTSDGLVLAGVETPTTTRDDVVLPSRVWRQVQENVHGLFRAAAQLEAAGLATNRGVLLAGPPGTGKTAICRVLAHELQGEVTTVFCDAQTVQHGITALYAHLERLSPALVVIEDIDLVVGSRQQTAGGELRDFLVALDGVTSAHRHVATVATTNAPDALDPAARRAARFDAVIDVPPPDREGRVAILGRYLRPLEVTVDRRALAAATDGMTGADLRELVSRAVMTSTGEGSDITTALLLRLAGERRTATLPGQYL